MRTILAKLIREDNFLSLSGNLIIAVLGFGGFALLARSLPPNDFAQWVLFISCGSLVEMLRYGITNNGLVRFLSGATPETRDQLIGANVCISLLATGFLALVILGIYWFFYEALANSPYALFFKWYPLLSFVNIPLNNALVMQQATLDFGKILLIRSVSSISFFTFLLVNYLFFTPVLNDIIIAYVAFNLGTSLLCLFKQWDGSTLLLKSNVETLKTLLHFGKYSTFTLIGTNLLRNADILLISISPFGSAMVALFSIPLKLTELQQIPLRSFAATAYPKMSKASIEGNMEEVQALFHVYCGALTYLFCFLSAITFVFAEEFVILISGYQYLNEHTMGVDIVTLVRILSVYGLLLPLDRMTGIGLDSINKPKINALKVCIMLGTNIVGDLLAIFVFESIEWVAISTLIFTAVGIAVGFYFLDKKFPISFSEIFNSAHIFYKKIWSRQFLKA